MDCTGQIVTTHAAQKRSHDRKGVGNVVAETSHYCQFPMTRTVWSWGSSCASTLRAVQLEMEKAFRIKRMERTHEGAAEALRAGRDGRHSETAFAGKGAHLDVV